MEERYYLGYIAHFLKNIDQLTSVDQYRKFFNDFLGTSDLLQAEPDKIKMLARKMYKAYILGGYLKYSPFVLLTGPTTKQLSELMREVSDLLAKYNLPEDLLDTDLSLSNIDYHIEKDSLGKYASILDVYLPEEERPKKTRGPSKKRTPTGSTGTQRRKKSAAPLPIPKGKRCSDVLRTELNEIALSRGIDPKGFTKADLCRELGIKA